LIRNLWRLAEIIASLVAGRARLIDLPAESVVPKPGKKEDYMSDEKTSDGAGAAASSDTIFRDREESEFYAQCVRDFLFRYGYELLENKEIVELGVGTGETIIELLKYHGFTGKIHGYEIDKNSFDYAHQLVEKYAVGDRYIVVEDDFFEAVQGSTTGGCAISNPPYLPGCDQLKGMPALWGGSDGSQVTKQIMDRGFESMILLVSSFSNPLSVIEYASGCGYRVLDFAVRTMRFGSYSNESKVRERISELSGQGEAFVSSDRYCIAGVAWVKRRDAIDLSESLARALTALAPQIPRTIETGGLLGR
jgi:hypothetical protein